MFYSGGKLAPDPTMPKLRTRWGPAADDTAFVGHEADMYEQAAARVREASERIRTATPENRAGAVAAAYAASDILSVLARRLESAGAGPLSKAAEAPTATRRNDSPRWSPVAISGATWTMVSAQPGRSDAAQPL